MFNKAKAAHGSLVAPLYDLFKTADSVPDAISARLKLPSSDKVLRRVVAHEDEGDVLVPSTAAMGFVLRYSEGGHPPSLSVVRTAVAPATGSLAAPTTSSSSAKTDTCRGETAERLA